jgi:hypothetical protein
VHICMQVWCVATSHAGDFFVTGGHDRSLRRWARSEEPFFVDEEKEKRLEALFEGGGEGGKDGGDEWQPPVERDARAESVVETSACKTQVCAASVQT